MMLWATSQKLHFCSCCQCQHIWYLGLQPLSSPRERETPAEASRFEYCKTKSSYLLWRTEGMCRHHGFKGAAEELVYLLETGFVIQESIWVWCCSKDDLWPQTVVLSTDLGATQRKQKKSDRFAFGNNRAGMIASQHFRVVKDRRYYLFWIWFLFTSSLCFHRCSLYLSYFFSFFLWSTNKYLLNDYFLQGCSKGHCRKQKRHHPCMCFSDLGRAI